MIRYHLDESVARSIAIGLSQRGIDASMPRETGLIGASDAEHLEFARQEGRVLFTHDDDFLALHRNGVNHAGIVFAAQGTRPIGNLVRNL